MSGVFLLGRVFDKLVFSALTVIYYWKVGRDFSAVNVPNIAGVLFLWCVLHLCAESSSLCDCFSQCLALPAMLAIPWAGLCMLWYYLVKQLTCALRIMTASSCPCAG